MKSKREKVRGKMREKMGRRGAAAMRMMAALVFLGYIALWMVAPTSRYWLEWLPKMRAETSSTYLGKLGTNLLVYTSPLLLISILGCLYIHLKTTSHETERKTISRRASFLKRPALVEGPLGIVSWTELAFLTMFIAFLTYYFSVSLSAGFSYVTPEHASQMGEKVWQMKLETSGLRLGLLGNLCLIFLFFPVTRGSSILPLLGLTSEGSIKYHIWLGHIVMVLFTLHGLAYIIYWASTDSISKMLEWAKTDISNLAGELSLLSGLVLWAATLPRVRRKMFEVFFYLHHFYVLFLLFFLLHVGIGYFALILPGVFLFMIDRFLRFLQSRSKVRLVSARLLPGDTVELNFAKSPNLEYKPMSNIFINAPAVSRLQWHPFTIASNSNLENDTLSVIIKKEGSWTQKLHQIISSSTTNKLEFSVEGPYGPISNTFNGYNSLVLISGGSGITPLISIIREFIFQSTKENHATPKIHLICAFKSSEDLTMLNLLLPLSTTISDLSLLNLQIDAYVTREKEPSKKAGPIQTLWFNPQPTQNPIAAVLGPHGWLLLAIIIASSFIFYLILLGLMNQYYIYPIDLNTNDIYPSTPKALLNLLIICASISLTATIIFLMNKRQYSSEAMKVQISDSTTPGGLSPPKAIQELESLPQDSIVQSTNVHFGGRPNLQRILLEQEGDNVGVFVSGPREMRKEVAKICGSGLANNLHYSSTSFSW